METNGPSHATLKTSATSLFSQSMKLDKELALLFQTWRHIASEWLSYLHIRRPPDEQHQTLCAFYAKVWMGPLTVAEWLDGQEGWGAFIGELSHASCRHWIWILFRKRFLPNSKHLRWWPQHCSESTAKPSVTDSKMLVPADHPGWWPES